MNSFVNGMQKASDKFTLTENGAKAINTTGSALLDLFGVIGAIRNRSESEVVRLFANAFAEDALLATRMAFYARNIRGGLGERNTAKIIWKWLANNYPEIMCKNLRLVPYFGRWDDMYAFVGTSIEEEMWAIILEQWALDVDAYMSGKPISIMAKWLRSVNASSAETKAFGKMTAKKLMLSESDYRKSLAVLRERIDVVERKMSEGVWTEINYSRVPSKAMANYRKAFEKHDGEGFAGYIADVQSGKATINSSTLYPYDILMKMGLSVRGYGGNFTLAHWDAVLEEQWKALPNYVKDGVNALVMADTSGSMLMGDSRPLATALGLAFYFAERNTGEFHNVFMTFSDRPSFVTVEGNTLKEKIECVPSIVSSTDLEAAFEMILNVAVRNKIDSEEMPKALIVISDMEINDYGCGASNTTFYEEMKDRFERCGFEIPSIIFWNVESRHDVFHAESDYEGVMLASGQSTSTFKAVLEAIGSTPMEAMLKVLNDPMYEMITV